MTTRCPTAWSLFLAWCKARKGSDQDEAHETYRNHLRNCPHCREWWKTVCAEDDERSRS